MAKMMRRMPSFLVLLPYESQLPVAAAVRVMSVTTGDSNIVGVGGIEEWSCVYSKD